MNTTPTGEKAHAVDGFSGGPVYRFLAGDHARLDVLLSRAVAESGFIERKSYEQFREGLLRHIAMEEKLLFPDAQRRHGEVMPIVRQLHAEHGALAGMLVPTPTHALLKVIREVLDRHNAKEEGPEGLYAMCANLAGPDEEELLRRLRAVPEVPVAAHVDGQRVQEVIADRLRSIGGRRSCG